MLIPSQTIEIKHTITFTHGFSQNFGNVNFTMTFPIDRDKYLRGMNIIDSLEDNIVTDFKNTITDRTRDV